MKTLNEVIKAFECCEHGEPDSKCEDCPYNGIGACTLEREADALHYLKTIETTENLYHDAVNELSKWKDEDWKDRCLPLTWDELKTMKGKPIWVEYDGYAPAWEVIEYIGNTKWKWGEVIETHLSILHKEDQEKVWQAYRKEPIQ